MSVPKTKPEPMLSEIIRAVVSAELAKRYARCHDPECGRFFDPKHTNLAGCQCCVYLASYCDHHGGFDRAVRGAVAHVRYFASRKAVTRFGTMHKDYWQTYRNRSVRRLKVVR